MSEPTKAIFLSYAREDADAARRIAEALRAFGVEVWFDQSELRGGDAWDQTIRTQIKTCALFMPIVSARTEERTEGYFRREWKLAVDRTHDMVGGRAFIVPIVIDGTAEKDAAVPEEFMRYQWTRLWGGEATPEFVSQVKRLLEVPRKPATTGGSPATAPTNTAPTNATDKAAPRGARWTYGSAMAVVVAIATALYVGRKPAAPAAAAANPPGKSAAPAVVAPVADKSIAVLPFANMSEDKDSAFFADGMHEDILTNLAMIRELRVTSRTSVMEYRGTTKKIRQIGAELGVAYVLEGSVRRAGNKVRVTGQLINVATDEHVWAKSYDRDLNDIFAIQSELSQAIATALAAALSPQERERIDSRPTTNLAAYDLFLKARAWD
ncbi:MAG TPA: TIR domain-containing protein, partial [Lacunisphaera sp.]